MNLLSCAFRSKKKHPKFQLVDLFRERKRPSSSPQNPQREIQAIDRFAEPLSKPIVSYQAIQSLAWNGIPSCLRPKLWKYLLKYMLINDAEQILSKKRQEYRQLLGNYWRPQAFSEEERKVYHTIDVDVKRIGTEYSGVCGGGAVQMLKRVLFIWHNRHPASGYVQGMCDLSMPFLIVFLSEYLPYDAEAVGFSVEVDSLGAETLEAVEADMYWCISKLLEGVTSNYTVGFDGLREAYSKVEELLYRIDPELYEHFKKEKIDLFAVSFRNISTMLLRIFNPNVGVRLFDTYIAYDGSFPHFMVFLFIAILEKFAKKLLQMRFEELMGFLQNLPTKGWNEQDLEMIIAEAYCCQRIFAQKQ